jgi:hypothetical protein
MWHAFLAWLASLAADPVALDREAPRAAAAVAAAYASLANEMPTPPAPPDQTKCCQACGGRGYITHADGHRTACPCPATCKCKANFGSRSPSPACPDGKCPIPGASLAPDAPARPAGGR